MLVLALVADACVGCVELVSELVFIANTGGVCARRRDLTDEAVSALLWIEFCRHAILLALVVRAFSHGHGATSGGLRCLKQHCG